MLRGGTAIQGARYGAGTTANPSGNDTNPAFGGSSGGNASRVPAPPSSYTSTTGTVTMGAALDPGGYIYALFHPSGQHIVQNSGGIFAAYGNSDNGNHDPSSWRMKRCPAGSDFTVAGNWSTLWDSTTKGDPQYGTDTFIETDQNDNVYVFANYYSSGKAKSTKMYVFTKASGWAAPAAPILLNSYASGKWVVHLDQGRSWIWGLYWSDGSTTKNLVAWDYSGNIVYQKNVFKAFNREWSVTAQGVVTNAAVDLHAASAHYQALWVDKNGRVYVAWNNLAFESPTTSFYDVRMVYSDSTAAQFQAGTETWMGPNSGQTGAASARTLPFCADDSGAQGELAYQIVKTSNQNEFIPVSNSGYWNGTSGKANYNRLFHITANNGAVHFYYESESSNSIIIQHHSYARWNSSTGTLADNERRTPEFHCDSVSAGDRAGALGGESGGNFVQDTSESSRLYFVQQAASPSTKCVRVLRSDDAGLSWWLYATGPSVSGAGANGVLNVQAHRWVQTDGSIIGICQLADSPFTVYPFKVTPN